MRIWVAALAGAAFCAVGGTKAAAATECDFDKPVGGCTANIKVLSASGSKPSFRAEISVRSSAPKCSKVEWYLDNTPQSTILKSGSSDTESVFGTSPISTKSISVERCTSYAEKNGQGSSRDAARYGSCASNAEARALLDRYDPAPNATLSDSLAAIRKNLPQLIAIASKYRGYRTTNPEFYAENKAQIEKDIAGYQERVDWNSNALRLLEGCAK